MEEELTFSTREEFRAWLRAHGEAGGGVWLVFGKPGGRKTLKASEALEEALCFGWIDGRMQRIDDASSASTSRRAARRASGPTRTRRSRSSSRSGAS